MNILHAKTTAPLYRIIRSSIRTTYCITRLDHSTTSSHMWLPFSLRCKLIILSIIHKLIYSFTLSYISDLIKNVQYYIIYVTNILLSLSFRTLVKLPYIIELLKMSVPPYGIPCLLPLVLLDPTEDL